MFDFGFSEMLLVAVIALIVVGPQRLPKVAKTVGHLLGRLQRYVSEVKSDVSREMQLDELKKLQQQVKEQARDLETSVRKQVDGVDSDLQKSTSELRREVEAVTQTDAPPMDPQAAAPVSDAQVNARDASSPDQSVKAEAQVAPDPGKSDDAGRSPAGG